MTATTETIICPTGEMIAQSTFLGWLAQSGLAEWDQLSASQEAEVNRIAKTDPATSAAMAARAADIAKSAADDVATESEIARITDGLDRETVMAMAKKSLRDARGYWPEIDNGTLTVRNTSDTKIVWTIGSDGWSQPISTMGSRAGNGAGYGSNI